MNVWVILGAALAAYILGALWYGPLFGKRWMKLVGLTKKDMDKNKDKMPMLYFGGFVTAVVTAYILGYLIDMTGSAGWYGGALLGATVWFGFIATTTMGRVLWEGSSTELWSLNNAYSLVQLLLMGAIIGAF